MRPPGGPYHFPENKYNRTSNPLKQGTDILKDQGTQGFSRNGKLIFEILMSLGNLGSQKSRLSFNVRLMFSPLESWGDVPTGQTRKAREQNSRKCVASSHWQPEPWLPVPLDICSCNSSYIFSVTVILTCFRSSSAESKMQAKVSEMLNLIIFG